MDTRTIEAMKEGDVFRWHYKPGTALSGGDIGPEQPWLERHIEERQS